LKEQITLIFALHEQDLKAQNLQKALDAIAPELQQLETLVATNRSQAEQKSAKMAELETVKRSKERDVETSEARQKDFQGKLSTIKTNKEYQAALKEISETKKINKATEDQILEVMTQLDGLKTEKQAVDEALQSSEANLEKRRAELSAESERLMGMLREVQSEKQVIAAKVDPALMAQYQRVRKGRPEAVSEVSGGTCQGCRMKIPPQLYIEIQKMKTIHACPSCQRLLYMPEWLEKKPEPKTENLGG
jgi:predicted  nucleic acid-binding Zn-ribbon protein